MPYAEAGSSAAAQREPRRWGIYSGWLKHANGMVSSSDGKFYANNQPEGSPSTTLIWRVLVRYMVHGTHHHQRQ